MYVVWGVTVVVVVHIPSFGPSPLVVAFKLFVRCVLVLCCC
ncbi:MAG: hypothetical protein ACOX08_11980 [Methanobacterium sp.]